MKFPSSRRDFSDRRLSRGIVIEMENGLPAIIYRLNHTSLKEVANACLNTERTRGLLGIPKNARNIHYTVTTNVDGEKIAFVYYCNMKLDDLLSCLKTDLSTALIPIFLVVYNRKTYSPQQRTGQILLKSIKDKVRPNITALLTPKT